MISEDRSRDDKGVHAATIKAIEALSKGPPKLAVTHDGLPQPFLCCSSHY